MAGSHSLLPMRQTTLQTNLSTISPTYDSPLHDTRALQVARPQPIKQVNKKGLLMTTSPSAAIALKTMDKRRVISVHVVKDHLSSEASVPLTA